MSWTPTRSIADLLEMGLLEVSPDAQAQRAPDWSLPKEQEREAAVPKGPSPLFWPLVVVLLAAPLVAYVPLDRASFNQGLASLRRTELPVGDDPETRVRQTWAFRMASPADGGLGLAKSLGVRLEPARTAIPDFTRYQDPLPGPHP